MVVALRQRRILLYGVTGAGKSTCAERLGALLGLPVVLGDEQTWRPGWVAVPEEEQRRIFTEITAGEEWVLDTAYGAWLDIVLPRTELVVGLDSILRWHFRSFTRKRERMRSWAASPDGPQVLLFRRQRDLEAWLRALPVES